MSLDVRLSSRKAIICPHCGKVVDYKFLDTVYSGGSVWYGFLKDIGYYVPHGELSEKNDWYGKDMVLTKEQAKNLVKYIKDNESFDYGEIKALVSEAIFDGDDVVISADWWWFRGRLNLILKIKKLSSSTLTHWLFEVNVLL